MGRRPRFDARLEELGRAPAGQASSSGIGLSQSSLRAAGVGFASLHKRFERHPDFSLPARGTLRGTSDREKLGVCHHLSATTSLLSDGTFNYVYDAEGNRTSRARISPAPANDYLTTYAWDYRNRLTDVRFYNNSSVLTKHVHYVYDVFDHRISKSLDATGAGSYSRIEDYVYDGNHVVLDFADPDGAGPQPMGLATRYLNGPDVTGAFDQVYSQEDAATGNVLWLLADNLGTTRDVVDNTGAVVGHFVYYSFGQLASGLTNLTRYLYTGQAWDADVGLQYNWHRWYDPAVGRWISEDPIEFAARDANLSRYVRNSQTNMIDPTGLIETKGNTLRDLEDWLLTITASDNAEMEAERIAAAIANTFSNNNPCWIPSLWYDDRVKGYYCFEWVYAFESAFNHESSGDYFTIIIQEAGVPGTDLVHNWIVIKSLETNLSIYVDDGFGNGNFVNTERPIPDGYEFRGSALSVPREKCSPPPAYDSHGDLANPTGPARPLFNDDDPFANPWYWFH